MSSTATRTGTRFRRGGVRGYGALHRPGENAPEPVDAAREYAAAGQTLEQAQASVLMEDYKDWEFYQQQRPQNVAGTYRALAAKK